MVSVPLMSALSLSATTFVLTRGDVLGNQRRGVPAAAVEPVERQLSALKPAGEVVSESSIADRGEGLRFDLAVRDPVIIGAAVVARLERHPELQVIVGKEAGITFVALDQRQLLRVEVEAVDVVPLRIAVIEADEDAILMRLDAPTICARVFVKGVSVVCLAVVTSTP